MNMVALDAHAVVKELMAAGFTDEQAEAVTRVVRQAQEIDLSNLATKLDLLPLKSDVFALKSDMLALKADVKADLAALRAEVKADMLALQIGLERAIAETRADTLKWMLTSGGVQVAIISAVVALARLTSH